MITVVFLFAYSLSFGAGYQVLSDTSFPIDRHIVRVNGLKLTSDGGYLIAGQAGFNEIRLIKAYPSGEKEWERIIRGRRGSNQSAVFTLEANGGGYWVVGTAKELEFMSEADAETAFHTKKPYDIRDISFLAKFSNAGEMESRLPLGLSEKFRGSRFVCGATTKDGVVLIGTKYFFYDHQPPSNKPGLVLHPWIVKLDTHGKFLWEAVIAEDGDGVFSGSYVDPGSCGGPYLSGDGSITFGLLVYWRPTYYKDGVRVLFGPGTEDKSNLTYLVVRLNSVGQEQARRRLDNQVRASLVRGKTGFVVVTNPIPVEQGSIRRTWLKSDLSIDRVQETKLERNTFLLEAPAIGRNNGLHLAGISGGGRGRSGVGHLTGEGKLVNLRLFESLAIWSIRGHVSGSRDDETALILHSDATVRLLRLKYRD